MFSCRWTNVQQQSLHKTGAPKNPPILGAPVLCSDNVQRQSLHKTGAPKNRGIFRGPRFMQWLSLNQCSAVAEPMFSNNRCIKRGPLKIPRFLGAPVLCSDNVQRQSLHKTGAPKNTTLQCRQNSSSCSSLHEESQHKIPPRSPVGISANPNSNHY